MKTYTAVYGWYKVYKTRHNEEAEEQQARRLYLNLKLSPNSMTIKIYHKIN